MVQIKADYLTKALVNLTQAEGDKLNLLKGEILKGMVESIKENGMIMVNLKGRSIEAFTDLVLTAGQELFLMVDEPQDGKSILRLATPQMMAERTNEKITVNLNQMGLKTDEATLAVAQKLMQHNLPVSKANIDSMMRITREMGGMTPATLELASTALAGGLKTDAPTMASLREFVSKPVIVKGAVEEAIKILENQVKQMPAAAVTSEKADQARTPAVQSQQAAAPPNNEPLITRGPNVNIAETPEPQANQIKPDQPKGQVPARPAQIIEGESLTVKAGGNQEELLIPTGVQTKPSGEFTVQTNPGLMSNGMVFPGNEFPTAKTIETLKLILPLLGLQGDDPEQILSELKQHFAGNKDVLKALNLAEQIMQKDPEAIKDPAVRHAVSQIQTAEQQLVGQAAFNSLDKPTADNNLPGYYYYAMPVEVNGQNHLVELKLYKDGKARRGLDEMNEVKVAVALDTKTLGQVVFHVTWNRDHGLTLQGAVQSEKTKAIIENGVPQLTEKLREMGFPVKYLGMKVAREREQMRPALEDVKDQSRILGIDIKV